MNKKLISIAGSLFVLICIVMSFIDSFAAPAIQPKALFSKKTPDGSTFVLEKKSHTEIRDKPKGDASKELPANAIFISGEYVVDKYRLFKIQNGYVSTIWEKEVSYLGKMKLTQDQILGILDIDQNKNEVCILFSSKNQIWLERRQQDKKGGWFSVSLIKLGKGNTEGISGEIVSNSNELLVEIRRDDELRNKWSIQDNKAISILSKPRR